MKRIFITNATQYAGPGIIEVLSKKGYEVICHDPTFTDQAKSSLFERRNNVRCINANKPSEIAHLLGNIGNIERFIFNDVHPNNPKDFENIGADEMRLAYEALVEFPFKLSQLLVQTLKQKQSGHMVFITSARQLQPERGFTVATAMRSAASAMALSLARELAPWNIQVNVVQPNYLYSELYYPKAHFIESEDGKKEIRNKVPLGRLGEPSEIGELVELFVSGRSTFTTGQIINFTGGWP